MPRPEHPIACDLGRLGEPERRRERELLARFRGFARAAARNGASIRYDLPTDAATLAAVGELLAYERLCCPFLGFELRVTAEAAHLEISGSAAALDLVLEEFGGVAGEAGGAP
jgi:hypothetical protein